MEIDNNSYEYLRLNAPYNFISSLNCKMLLLCKQTAQENRFARSNGIARADIAEKSIGKQYWEYLKVHCTRTL